jgi:4-hydroxybenzoate polyprenyltransferase
MQDPQIAPPAAGRGSALQDALAIARYHIVLVAMGGMMTFGWLMTQRYLFALALVVGLDWFLINLLNRITDIAEDLRNHIAGTERVAQKQRPLTALAAVLLVGSFVLTHLVWPQLTPLRVAVQLIGLGYNYRIVPSLRGLTRFKEMYFFKNFGSAVLFVLTCFAYPLAVAGPQRVLSWPAIGTLALFFMLFETTYEILYDFRDLEGDRALGVPTYPVVHGERTAYRIMNGLLITAELVLAVGLVTGALGVREALMAVAPLVQYLFYRRYRVAAAPPTNTAAATAPAESFHMALGARDCVLLTHLGTAQLILFLCGTALWQHFGLPANIYLR